MKVKLAIGTELDILTEAELRKALNDHARALANTLRVKPMGRTLRQAGAPNAAGVAVIDLGGPPNGFEWEVRRYFVTGQDPATTIAGSAAVVYVASAPDLLSPLEAIDTTATGSVTTLPNKGAWTDDQVIVDFGRRLLIRGSGLGTTTIYASAFVIERASTQETTPQLVIPIEANGQRSTV